MLYLCVKKCNLSDCILLLFLFLDNKQLYCGMWILVEYYLLVVFWGAALSHVCIGGILFAGGVWCSAVSYVGIGGILFAGGVLGCCTQPCVYWWNIICRWCLGVLQSVMWVLVEYYLLVVFGVLQSIMWVLVKYYNIIL